MLQTLVTVYAVDQSSPASMGTGYAESEGSAGQSEKLRQEEEAVAALLPKGTAAAVLQAPLLEDRALHRAARSGDADKVT